MPKLLPLALIVAGMMQVSPVAAAPAADSAVSEEFSDFSLQFSATDGCPERAEFEADLLSRAPAARLREPRAGTLALSVALAAKATTFTGVLTITLPNGARSERTVEAASCRDGSLSLAVIASLVLEAYREHRPLPGMDTLTSSATEPSAAESASTASPPAAEVSAVTNGRSAPPPSAEARPNAEPDAPQERTSRPNFAVFGGLTLETAVAESPPLGALAGVQIESRGYGVWSPSARLGGLFTTNGSSRANAGSADFRLITARLALCPSRFAATQRLSFTPCVELDAGSLRGGASSAPNPTARHMPWLALGAAGRAEWTLGKVVSLEASAGVRALSRQDRFVLAAPGDAARNSVLYDVPGWSAGFAVGASFRLP